MIKITSVPLVDLKRAPYRDTFSAFDAERPMAVEHIVQAMRKHVEFNGATLLIHVAFVADEYLVLDGHLALDVYETLGRQQVTVIVHSDVTTAEQAKAKYVALNYLRNTEWLRDGVKLQKTLTDIGITVAYDSMEDPQLAKDLIERNAEQWDKFSKEILLREHETPEHNEDQLSGF